MNKQQKSNNNKMNIKKQLNDELNKVFDTSWQWVYDMEDEPEWVANKEKWQGYLAETEERDYSIKVIFLTIQNRYYYYSEDESESESDY